MGVGVNVRVRNQRKHWVRLRMCACVLLRMLTIKLGINTSKTHTITTAVTNLCLNKTSLNRVTAAM